MTAKKQPAAQQPAPATVRKRRPPARAPKQQQPTALVPKLLLSITEAAASLGMSRASFYRRVLPQLATIKEGRMRLVPVGALEAYIARKSA